jgi:hypothetical protein
VWHDNGLIDKDNYAFLQGLSTTEPLMIKNGVGRCQILGQIIMYYGY